MDGLQHPLNAFLRVLGGSPTLSEQLVQQAPPLGAENVSACQAAIPADDTQVGDAVFHQVAGGTQPPSARGEGFAAGTADHRPTLQRENGTGGHTPRHAGLGRGWDLGVAWLSLTSWMMLETLSQLACLMLSPPSTSPS